MVVPGGGLSSAGLDATRKREGARAIVKDRTSRRARGGMGRWERLAFRVAIGLVLLVAAAYLVSNIIN